MSLAQCKKLGAFYKIFIFHVESICQKLLELRAPGNVLNISRICCRTGLFHIIDQQYEKRSVSKTEASGTPVLGNTNSNTTIHRHSTYTTKFMLSIRILLRAVDMVGKANTNWTEFTPSYFGTGVTISTIVRINTMRN